MLPDFRLGIVKLKNAKHLEKELNKELMLVAWHPKRWWHFYLSEDEEKEKLLRYVI